MSVVVIGKNSFLASHLREAVSDDASWMFLSHKEALENLEWLNQAKIVLNFALHPDMKTGPYNRKNDIDLNLAQHIKGKCIHYVMMSTRMVYGAAPDNLILHEDMDVAPNTPYSRNKWQTEQALHDILRPNQLTILRMGNIFGCEQGRRSFLGAMLDGLRKENCIRFDIAEDSRRDFLSVWRWRDDLVRIVRNICPGLYNIGSGIAATPKQLADWLIQGHGQGRSEFTGNSYDGQFVLDVKKSAKAFGLVSYTQDDLKADILRTMDPKELERG